MVLKHGTERRLADAEGIARGAALLRAGRLVAFPTETVYGLGADARSGEAVASIYLAKGRPRFNPLIAHVATVSQALAEGQFNREARALASAFWPGPLTIVVPAANDCTICDLARAGLNSVGLRVPDHTVARQLLMASGFPVAAPSANRSGRISPTQAEHVAADLLGEIDLILDGGATSVGVESTIISCLGNGVRLLRPGGITRYDIERVIGRAMAVQTVATSLVAPGMMASHYAPRAAVRLNAHSAHSSEAALDFGGHFGEDVGTMCLDLSPGSDLREAAANLFGFLRRLDASGPLAIAVAPIPNRGLGEAINDRLARAAAPRS
jgi:L-threonylcarbamoyladenylate synthase